jgi:hypothetical protein
MTFEQTLRRHLHQDAAALPLPERDPERAVGRARAHRRRRLAATGVVATTAVAVAATTMLDHRPDPSSVATPGALGLTPTGPLDLDWQLADGGLYNVTSAFQDDDAVYALSTGPGVRTTDYPDGAVPRALYRLADDGTWQPLALEGERPRAVDVSGGTGLLYAVSTGPASGGDGTIARLSASEDGGETWTTEDLAPAEPPSDAVEWRPTSTMAVESLGSTTIALVTTSFYPDVEGLFPELDTPAGSAEAYAVEPRDEGLVLLRYAAGGDAATAPTASTTTPAPDDGARSAGGPAGSEQAEGEPVRTVAWSDLGVDGIEALASHVELFRRAGDAWEPLAGEVGAFDGAGAIDLGVAGDRFLATSWVDPETTTTLTSTDGTSWSAVAAPEAGTVVGVGSALVSVPTTGTVLQVSGDAGATWSEVDLADQGVAADDTILVADGGPLGLALVVGREADLAPRQLVVSGDLVDWTVTPLADVLGDHEAAVVTPFVGEDRIVLTATEPAVASAPPPASVTAVATPIRTP